MWKLNLSGKFRVENSLIKLPKFIFIQQKKKNSTTLENILILNCLAYQQVVPLIYIKRENPLVTDPNSIWCLNQNFFYNFICFKKICQIIYFIVREHMYKTPLNDPSIKEINLLVNCYWKTPVFSIYKNWLGVTRVCLSM